MRKVGKAIKHINHSIDNFKKPDSQFINKIKNEKDFEILHLTEEWKAIMIRLNDIESKIEDK